MKVSVFGGELLQFYLNERHFDFISDINSTLSNESACIVIEDRFEQDNSDINGKELIFKIRLKHKSTQPIVLVYRIDRPLDDERYIEVLQDPYVHLMDFETLVTTHTTPEKLLELFQPIQSKEDIELLYTDLRQTIYRKGGYLAEIKHSLLNKINESNRDDLQTVDALIRQSCQDTIRLLTYWSVAGIRQNIIINLFSKCIGKQNIEYKKSMITDAFKNIDLILSNSEKKATGQIHEKTKIIYISKNKNTQHKLKTLFEKHVEVFNISCINARTLEEARPLISANPKIAAVLSDYRFRNPESNKIDKINGYHLIKALKAEFQAPLFALLSDFEENRMIQLPGFSNISVYVKSEVFSSSHRELFRLASAIIQQSEKVLLHEGVWPKVIGTKDTEEDKIWCALHDEKLLTRPDFEAQEQEIGDIASLITQRLIVGDTSTSMSIPMVAGALSRVRNPNIEHLKKRLIVRRIILGLINNDNLLLQYKELLTRITNHKSINPRFAVIYKLLTRDTTSKEHLTLDRRVLSNYFSDNFRIHISKDYSKDAPGLLKSITLAEYRWLMAHAHLFK